MNYKISRNGQEYGPYTLEELQQYVNEGSILPNDYAFNGLEWVTVSQLLQDTQRGLATAHSVSGAAHAVSSIGDKISQTNNPRSKSVLNRKVNDGCFPMFLFLVGIFAITKGNGNKVIIGLGILFILLGAVMFLFSGKVGGSGRSGRSGYSGCSFWTSCSSCSSGSSGSSCGGGCGGCGGCGGGD